MREEGGGASKGDVVAQALVDNRLAVDNPVVCKSVAAAIRFLFAKYPLPEDSLFQEALQGFSKYVALQVNEKNYNDLVAAWRDYQGLLAEKVDQFDKEGDIVYPLKDVFTLIYRASVDQAAYPAGNEDEASLLNRLAAIATSMMTLHKQGKRCHRGVRNDLVQLLHGVYPGVELAADSQILCESLLIEEILAIVNKKSQDDTSALYYMWAVEQEMPETFFQELTKPAQKVAIFIGVQSKYAKAFGMTLDEARQETSSILEEYFNEEALPYLSQIPRDVQSVRELWDFYALKVHSKLLEAHQKIKKWAEDNWHFKSNHALITDFLLVEKVNSYLLNHESALRVECADLVDQVHEVIDRFCSANSIAELSKEDRLKLTDFSQKVLSFLKENGVSAFTSFFARLYALNPGERMLFSIAFLDTRSQERIKVNEAWVENWQPNAPGKPLDITPYQINRMLLTAYLVQPKEWGEKFAERLQVVVDFISSDFNQTGFKSQDLRRDSYPDSLLLYINFLLRSYHSVEPIEMTAAESSAFTSSGLKMIRTVDDLVEVLETTGMYKKNEILTAVGDHRLAAMIRTVDDLVEVLGATATNKDNQLKILTAVGDHRLAEIISTGVDLVRILKCFSDREDFFHMVARRDLSVREKVFNAVKGHLGGMINTVDDLVEVLNIFRNDRENKKLILAAVVNHLDEIIQSRGELIKCIDLCIEGSFHGRITLNTLCEVLSVIPPCAPKTQMLVLEFVGTFTLSSRIIDSFQTLTKVFSYLHKDLRQIVLAAMNSSEYQILPHNDSLFMAGRPLFTFEYVKELFLQCENWPKNDIISRLVGGGGKVRIKLMGSDESKLINVLWEGNPSFRESVMSQPKDLEFLLKNEKVFTPKVRNSLHRAQISTTLRQLSENYQSKEYDNVAKAKQLICDSLINPIERLVSQLVEEDKKSTRDDIQETKNKIQLILKALDDPATKKMVFMGVHSRLAKVIKEINRYCLDLGSDHSSSLLRVSVLSNRNGGSGGGGGGAKDLPSPGNR